MEPTTKACLNTPLVSILITAFNREKYIAEAIESVLISTYKNFELIIVDDQSNDRTFLIACKYLAIDSRVRVYVNDENLGDYLNRNKAAGYARGKYLKYLDSDDAMYPWSVEAMVGCMERFEEAGFGLMSYGLSQDRAYPVLLSSRESYRAFFFSSSLIAMGPSGAIIRRDIFEKLGGFSGKPYVGDTELWLKMARKFPLIRMPNDLIWWREHEDQQIKKEAIDHSQFVVRYNLYKSALEHPDCPLSPRESQIALRNLKNVRIRRLIIDYFLKLKLKTGFNLLWKSKFTMLDIAKAFRRNVYIVD